MLQTYQTFRYKGFTIYRDEYFANCWACCHDDYNGPGDWRCDGGFRKLSAVTQWIDDELHERSEDE